MGGEVGQMHDVEMKQLRDTGEAAAILRGLSHDRISIADVLNYGDRVRLHNRLKNEARRRKSSKDCATYSSAILAAPASAAGK
jgi:hypothetical protein